MRLIALSVILVLALAPVALADYLVGAPLGEGGMAVNLGYDTISSTRANSASINYSSVKVGSIPLSFGYGVNDNLDLWGKIGYVNTSNLQIAGVDATQNGLGGAVALKYTFLKENNDIPVSIAAAGGYILSSLNSSVTLPGVGACTSLTSGSDMAIGVVISKLINNFLPYGGIAYHSVRDVSSDLKNAAGTIASAASTEENTNIQLNAGCGIFFSESFGVLVEYNTYSVSPKTSGVTAYNNSTIGLAAAYLL